MPFYLLLVLVVSVPRYLVYDVKRVGPEYLEKQGAKVIVVIDSVTYLVEGELDKMDHSPYEIALYREIKDKVKARFTKGQYYIPFLPEVNSYLSQINVDSIFSTLWRLQGFKTRFAYTDSCRQAEYYLYQRMANYVDSATLWPFEYQGYLMNNVVGIKRGSSLTLLC